MAPSRRPFECQAKLAAIAFLVTWASCTAVRGADVDLDLVGYRKIVSQYRSGDVDAAVGSIAAWDSQRLLRAARKVRQPKRPDGQIRGWDAPSISSACLLHLEVLVRNPERRRLGALHMQVMREHLAGLRRLHGLPPTTAELHLGLAIYLQGQLGLEDLQAFFDELGKSGPAPGVLLLAEGTLHEVLASRRLEMARRALLVPSAKKSLDRAESLLRQALAEEPDLTEARLRLGHVLVLQGRPDEAGALLQPILERSVDADQRYLAGLFLGQAHATAGRLEAARQAYAGAAAECPCGQAAAMALAHFAFDERQLDAARKILAVSLRPSAGCTDPWALYDFGQVRKLSGLITELREALRE